MSKSAAVHAERTAVRCGSRRLSYRELDREVSLFASGLTRLGLRRSDRLALFMRNSVEYVVTMMGGFRAGSVVVPVNAKLHAKELLYILDDAEAAGLVFDAEHAETVGRIAAEMPCRVVIQAGGAGAGTTFEDVLALGEPDAPNADVRAGELAWLFYTSGTTGRPKGAMLSHRNLERMALNCLADVCSFQPEDVVLHAAPLSHGSGMYLLPSLARGADNLIFDGPRFDAAEVLIAVEREQVTVIAFLAPTMLVMLVQAGLAADTRSLRRIVYGGAPMHVEHARAALERFGPILTQLYGQGEAPMTITYLRAEDHVTGDEELLGSAGIPRTDVEVRVVDALDRKVQPGEVGEVVVRGDVVMHGYWRNEAATAEALRGGWLHTGDIGRFGPNGRLSLLDRKHDVIITGGANVYPREVEEVLLLHPGVSEVAVFGLPDPLWGERVAAAVVPSKGWQPSAEELVGHCREHLAGFKKPRLISFVEALPTSAYGKVLRRELRDSR